MFRILVFFLLVVFSQPILHLEKLSISVIIIIISDVFAKTFPDISLWSLNLYSVQWWMYTEQ